MIRTDETTTFQLFFQLSGNSRKIRARKTITHEKVRKKLQIIANDRKSPKFSINRKSSNTRSVVTGRDRKFPFKI